MFYGSRHNQSHNRGRDVAESDEKSDEKLDEKFEEIHKKLDLILSAFPSGHDGKPDPMAHRRYHEDEARYIEDKRKLWSSVRSAVVTGAVWSCLGFLALAAWRYIKLIMVKGDLP